MATAWLFDFDGTIVDASERHYQAYSQILTELTNCDPLSKEEFWGSKRQGASTVELLPNQLSSERISAFESRWIDNIEDRRYLQFNNIVPSARETLRGISTMESKFVLVTNRKKPKNVRWELEKYNIKEHFDKILVNDPMGDVTKAEFVSRKLDDNITPACIIGDSGSDMEAGKILNISTIATTYGIRNRKFLEQYSPDAFIDSFSDVRGVEGI
jgi:phosphoglycolate phosphatase-like HAD superfamily hydrolase